MTKALFRIEPLLAQLAPDSLAIVANRRLAGHIQAAYDQHQAARQQVWQSIEIATLEQWLQQAWEQLLLAEPDWTRFRALDSAQELLLWEQVISRDGRDLLLRPQLTARSAHSAYRKLCLWQAPLSGPDYNSEDSVHFAAWIASYRKTLQRQQLLDYCARLELISTAQREARLASKARIVLVGFQSLPPAYEQLLQHTTSDLRRLAKQQNHPQTRLHACADREQEWVAAANWCRQLQAEDAGKDPSQRRRIGVIVPELAQLRAQIERIFCAVLQPHASLAQHPRAPANFNLSAGQPLGGRPMIAAALRLLSLNRAEIETEQLLSSLRSPFLLRNAASFGASARLEQRLREGGRPTYGCEALMRELRYRQQSEAQQLAGVWADALERLHALRQEQLQGRGQLSAEQWLALFRAQLALFGWPGARGLDSSEYQEQQRWQQALLELERILALQPEWSLGAMLAQLESYMNSLSFQPQSAANQIQILGLLEGAGLDFDALWLVGMNDDLWPAPPRPDSLIPIALQKAHRMPHANAEREWEFSARLFADYCGSTSELRLSYACHTADQPLRPSLLLPLDRLTDNTPSANSTSRASGFQHPLQTQLRTAARIESLLDEQGPALQPQQEEVFGGSQIIKSQAACPFQAFARYRLGAAALPQLSPYLQPWQRGNALHRALEHLWQQLDGSAALAKLEQEEIASLLTAAVAQGLRALQAQRPDIFNASFSRLEQERLTHLLQASLAVERERTTFRVAATEQSLSIEVAGLPLRVRIDRIDRLEDDSLFIIDYKTGQCSLADWQSARLKEPQLPLYCIGAELQHRPLLHESAASIAGLAFFEINAERVTMLGIAAQDRLAPGVQLLGQARYWSLPNAWPELRAHWREVIAALARDFLQGQAQVDPKTPATCQHCDLQPLCRIHANRLESTTEESA